MDDTLLIVLQAVILAVIPVLTTFLVKFLTAKAQELKTAVNNTTVSEYIDEITRAVNTAVACTNQTYVDDLKGKNMFDKNTQTHALLLSLDAAKASISASALEYIKKMYGDSDKYLETRIEAEVKRQKSDTPKSDGETESSDDSTL